MFLKTAGIALVAIGIIAAGGLLVSRYLSRGSSGKSASSIKEPLDVLHGPSRFKSLIGSH